MSFWSEERLSRIVIFLTVIMLLIIASNFIKLDYYITAPGVALELEQIVTVENGEKDAEGGFYLTAVTSTQANLFSYIYILLSRPEGIEITPKEETLPEGVDREQFIAIMEDMMHESQMVAKLIGLRQMGYETKMTGQGAEVVEVMEESQAKDILQKGDIIVAIKGEPVSLNSEAVQIIKAQKVGEIIPMKVKRDGEVIELEVPTMELENQSGKTSIGIYILTYNREYSFPIDVDIVTKNIVGPSAGTMFTLEIINQLHEEDLTQGYKIAGTGTINPDGTIGPIDGVKQKVLAAEREGASYFLSPPENYEDAAEAATKLQVVNVETIQDAVEFLESLEYKYL